LRPGLNSKPLSRKNKERKTKREEGRKEGREGQREGGKEIISNLEFQTQAIVDQL
jgi:hypothetical protein